jgi:hypothetical protein
MNIISDLWKKLLQKLKISTKCHNKQVFSKIIFEKFLLKRVKELKRFSAMWVLLVKMLDIL